MSLRQLQSQAVVAPTTPAPAVTYAPELFGVTPLLIMIMAMVIPITGRRWWWVGVGEDGAGDGDEADFAAEWVDFVVG